MLKDLKGLYVAISNNEVVCFETNRDAFVKQFLKIEPSSRKQDWFYRRFQKESRFSFVFDKTEYWFQRLV